MAGEDEGKGRKAKREGKLFHLLVHFTDSCNSQVWVSEKIEMRNLLEFPIWVTKTIVLSTHFCCLLGFTLIGTWFGRGGHRIQTRDPDISCKHTQKHPSGFVKCLPCWHSFSNSSSYVPERPGKNVWKWNRGSCEIVIAYVSLSGAYNASVLCMTVFKENALQGKRKINMSFWPGENGKKGKGQGETLRGTKSRAS